MPRPITITVVIPTLNEAPRIGTLLRALQEQHRGIEYSMCKTVVVDGGSSDQTRAIVQQFPDVELLESERGVSRQRNLGGRSATSDLVVFMDADCLPSPGFLIQIARSYRRLPFRVACPWFVARESIGVRVAYWFFNVLFFLGQSTLRTGSGVCLLVRREVFEQVGGFDESLHLGEDIHFLRRCGWPHRHLLVPLQTSGRRFQSEGVWKLMSFYARISPAILLGRYQMLRDVPYEAAPYQIPKRKVVE
jgi:glycosyltransferase involved in cell wall biosynthesis